MPSSQRPFFLSSFLAAFRQQPGSTSALSAASSQPNKTHTHGHPQSPSQTSTSARAISTTTSSSPSSQSVMSQIPIHSPRAAHHHHHHHHHHQTTQHGSIPIPGAGASGRRRGSDSSSEGFRDVIGGDKWYIGGRTAAGEEKFFKLGVVRRVKSNDRLSLDQLSL